MTLTALRFHLYSLRLARSKRPILIGPWRSEVGFEALYWLPFLAWWRNRYQIDPKRLIAIGRGGSGAWYEAGGIADVYDHLGVQEIRTLTLGTTLKTGSVKQQALAPWESSLCGLVAASLGIARYHVLHPSWMYQLLEPWWADRQPLPYVHGYTRYSRLAPPPVPAGLTLPEKFIAARFYARSTFPPGEDVLLWLQGFVERLSQVQPVVLLHSGLHYDDHADLVKPVKGRVMAVPPEALAPNTNLATLSAILGRAQAFVGTYGGFQQLALRMGIPSLGFFVDFQGTAMAHKTLSHVLATASGVPFVVARPKDAEHFAGLLTDPLQPGVQS